MEDEEGEDEEETVNVEETVNEHGVEDGEVVEEEV